MLVKKILVVCMLDSIHSARWLSQFAEAGFEFTLFPSSPHRQVHPRIRDLVNGENKSTYNLSRGHQLLGIFAWLLDKPLRNQVRAFVLRRLISSVQPTIVHAMEFQNAGYLVHDAIRGFGAREFQLIVTNWGSDIYWFARQAKHKRRIIALLDMADGYSCECERDVQLAYNLGYTGKIISVAPNAGGIPDSLFEEQLRPFRDRTAIAVKGYHGWAGRGLTAIRAIRFIRRELSGYEVILYSCNVSTFVASKLLSLTTNLRVTAHLKGSLGHDEMFGIFARSAVYVGLSRTDGISTSLLEAMAMGAIPVQTSTSCCDEWFDTSGVVVNTITAREVAEAVRKALILAKSTDSAYRNRRTVRARASATSISNGLAAFYGY